MTRFGSPGILHLATLQDTGREVAAVKGIDHDWHVQPAGTIVQDVKMVYGGFSYRAVKVGRPDEVGLWYSSWSVLLDP